jgi:hypothetical protein
VITDDTFVSHAQGRFMTRRWSLIATITALAVGLALVVAQLVRGQGAEGQQASDRPAAQRPGADPEALDGVG